MALPQTEIARKADTVFAVLPRVAPTELMVYRGFGHGITKPKEQLVAVWHNWRWFGKYIFGEQVTIPLDEAVTP